MRIGNTQTPIRFPMHPDEYMDAWFNEAPTHLCAISAGRNASVLRKVSTLLNVERVTLGASDK